MTNDLLDNLEKIHSTELGIERIRKNMGLDTVDIVSWCKQKIENANDITRKGKNWYVHIDDCVITINAHSFTIITAHKGIKSKFCCVSSSLKYK
jgi:hypothetical protein